MDDFALDELAFEELLKEELLKDAEEEAPARYKICEECGIDMLPDINNTLTCVRCGLVVECITDNAGYEPSMDGYNTSEKFHIPIKCVGKNSFQYQKQLRNNTSQYSLVQEATMKRKLEALNFKSPVLKIPKNIITSVINQYKLIRQTSRINRGSVLDGIIGSLIYYECVKEGIIRKPKEISEWMRITENDLSKGDKIVRALEADGVLSLASNDNCEVKYVYSYLKRMNMSMQHSDFMLDLFYRLEELRIGNPNSRLSTKISAILFMVVISKNLPVEAEEISAEFNIAISTFKAFYNEVIKRRKYVQNILDKHSYVVPDKIPRKKRIKKTS